MEDGVEIKTACNFRYGRAKAAVPQRFPLAGVGFRKYQLSHVILMRERNGFSRTGPTTTARLCMEKDAEISLHLAGNWLSGAPAVVDEPCCQQTTAYD